MTTPNHIVLLNNSGNVGKSTLAKFLLQPRMENARIIPVETINAHEHDGVENIKGRQYGDLIESLVLLDNSIVDVGASNVEEFLSQMNKYEGSHEVFDYFVIPVTPRSKQITDTIATVMALSDMGISSEKIRIIFNMVENPEIDIESEFKPIFDYHKSDNSFVLDKNSVVYHSEFFARVANTGGTIESILNDKTDFNALIKAATDSEEKYALAQSRGVLFLARGIKKVLDSAFTATFKD